jgi:hypothetical protein
MRLGTRSNGAGNEGAANALSDFAISIYKNLVAPLNSASYSESSKHSADQWIANNMGSEALFWSNVTAYQMALSKRTENYPDADPVLTQALMAHLGMITPDEAVKNMGQLPEFEYRQAESVMVFNAGTLGGIWEYACGYRVHDTTRLGRQRIARMAGGIPER